MREYTGLKVITARGFKECKRRSEKRVKLCSKIAKSAKDNPSQMNPVQGRTCTRVGGTMRRGGARPPRYRQGDDARDGPVRAEHGPAQGVHGVGVGLVEEGLAVDVEELVVGAQAAVARRGAAVKHALHEDAQVVRRGVHVAYAVVRGRFAFHAHACKVQTHT